MNFSEELQRIPFKEFRIWTDLIKSGYETFLVGGGVRDIILGNPPKDWDFATNATPSQIREVFKDHGYKINLVGATFGVVIIDGIEVATFRGDRYFGGGDKDVEITYVDSILEDLKRRDFTFNAMALSLQGDLIDPHGGRKDLLNGRRPLVRFVGDANERIAEDPNRILRAFRFASTIGAVLAGETFKAVEGNLHKVALIAPERVRLELLKVLETSDHPSYFWIQLRSTGVLEILFPEFLKTYGHDHGEYHREDIWTHSMIAGNHVSKKFPLIRLAAFLHDVGKPRSYDPDGRSFHQHHTHSADIIREWMTATKFSGEEIRYVVNLALVHMDGTRGMTAKARRKLKNKLGRYDLQWRDYVRLRIADRAANTSRKPFTLSQIRDYVEIFTIEENVPVTVQHLDLKGGEIIRIFNLTPGPIVSKVQEELLDHVLEEGEEYNNLRYLVALASVILGLDPDFDLVESIFEIKELDKLN